MIDYYIVIDRINKNNLITFRIYEFNPEISLKPIEIRSKYCKEMDDLIDSIEELIDTRNDYLIYILSNDAFLRNIFDNNINKFNHIKIKYNRDIGYRVFRIISKDTRCNMIELLDISASGILKHIRKIKNINEVNTPWKKD